MKRTSRVLVLLLSLLIGLVAVGAGPAGIAAAAAKPKITTVGSGAGPLAPTTVTIKGSNLARASAVKFGSKKGKIVKVVSATEVVVKTPRMSKAATVKVTIKTPGGWSAKVRYAFVAKPSLTKLSVTSGRYTGGDKVKLSGKNLSRTSQVLFGTAAATILSRASTSVVVTTPVGVLGAAKVTVVTPGGTSGSRTFTYLEPPRQNDTTIDAATGTYTPSTFDWVTGGYDADTGITNPWVVGLPKGADLPTVGQAFLIKPGSAAFPSGLAGTVDSVAAQVDDSTRVTVTSSDLAKSLDHYSVDYSGPLTDEIRGQRRKAVSGSIEFPLDRTALFCHDEHGQSVSFGVSDLKMYISDVDVTQHLDLGGFIHKPSFDATLTTEVTTGGTFHVEGASTCGVKDDWANAHRRVFLLGTSGATISIGPAFQFSVSGKGSFKILDRTRTTWAVDAELGGTPRFSKTSRSVEHEVGGAFTFTAELAAGIDIRLGVLDRAGVTGKIFVGVSAEVETVNASNVCIDAKLVLDLSIGLFFDLWVKTWESPSLHASIDLFTFIHACMRPEAEPTPSDSEPEITSARLPDAYQQSVYRATLATADGREGTWTIAGYALPSGLSLDGDSGVISGTPTGAVGDYPVIIDFTDDSGQVATTVIRIRVQPPTGIGGGDIQVTLQWTGPADLDLHVQDPSGEEIYYGNPTSASGGELDHDANAGCNGPADDDNAIENIYWPPHAAPVGSYLAWVVVWSECSGPLDWHLTIRRNGVVILDQTGSGGSTGYSFGVGVQGAAKQLATRTPPTRQYPDK